MGVRSVLLSFLFLFTAVLSSAELAAQVVGGRVLGQAGATPPVARISFFFPDGGFACQTDTDENGTFLFPEVDPGKYFMEVLGAGFEAWRAGPLVVGGGDTLIVALSVAPNDVPEDPILVLSSNRPWYEFLQPAGLWPYWERRERFEPLGTGDFFTQADLSPWKGQQLSLAVSALSPFLSAVPIEGGGGGLQLRGPRGCTPLVFLDGHKVHQGTEGAGRVVSLAGFRGGEDVESRIRHRRRGLVTSIDQFISLSQVAALEIYRGASDIPGEFRVEEWGSQCGAVVVWSQRGPTGG